MKSLVELPSGYRVYVLHFRDGFTDLAKDSTWQALQTWGTSFAVGIYVGAWSTEDKSWDKISRRLMLKSPPAIVVTDSRKLARGSVIIKIDDETILNDLSKLEHLLSGVRQKFLLESKDAIKKKWIRNQTRGR